MSPKFVIIDGSSLVHRAFYALPLLTTASGQYTNAAYGFTTMLVKLLADIKPDAVAVAFDKGRITFRNNTYSEYKAHRKPTPTELSEQFPLVKEILQAFHIRVLEEAGYEGDDIIGTLSVKAVQADCDVIIVTGDRDALQLIGPKTKVLLTKKGISELEIFDAEAFRNKYKIDSNQLIDVKGLMGDTSDNIPGVPGIGEKTATKLVAEFGSVENILDNIDRISGKKLQDNLRTHQDMAILSKKLATIACDMPFEFMLDEFKYAPDSARLRELFNQFEFKSLLLRMGEIFPGNGTAKTGDDEFFDQCTVAADEERIAEIVADIRHRAVLLFYPVLQGGIPELSFMGMAVWDGNEDEVVYISAQSKGWSQVVQLLNDDAVRKITYDAKPVYNACRHEGILLRGLEFDVLLGAYLLDPTAAEYPLRMLTAKYLNGFPSLRPEQEQDAQAIACWAVTAVARLYPKIITLLKEWKLETLYRKIELPLVDVLSAMESCGITIDEERLQVMSEEIAARISELLQEIYSLAGEQFNVNSTKQLGVLLFDKFQLPVIKKTKTGYSTDAEVLEKLSGTHPIIDCLLEYRMLTKLKSTYLDGLAGLVHSGTKRIHTTFNQTVTATGRLSSSEPNLQNIPIRTDIGRKIRELFIPGAGFDYIMSADYSQIELRILAHMSQDDGLIDAFKHSQDIHTRTAAEVFGIPMSAVTPEMRSRAKAVNFGIVYGISDYGLSRDIGVTRREAGQYIESYFARYHGVKEFIDAVVQYAHTHGYVTTMFERRRYLPEINSSNFNQRSFAERTAMNTPIQGTAADIIKKAMIDVYSELAEKKFRSRILLQVHDELLLEVPAAEVDRVSELVKRSMERAVMLAVPMVADVKIGKNWASAK
ncbi:DNA polymerase I [Propionispora sp. 2/2-37]|uniref:DNA polymerase I n=1 Tax=Propionispora sp. 2/2-37 TaxID=1677858 RepID=UPI0006BB8449|nr:DNA polymerase I [Propionispora sp. 2/2-37]